MKERIKDEEDLRISEDLVINCEAMYVALSFIEVLLNVFLDRQVCFNMLY